MLSRLTRIENMHGENVALVTSTEYDDKEILLENSLQTNGGTVLKGKLVPATFCLQHYKKYARVCPNESTPKIGAQTEVRNANLEI